MIIKKIKRNKIKKQLFSKEWCKIMERNVPLYNCLPGKLKAELQDHIKIFISEKNIEGCGGLTITEEIKVTIAAQACILILNRNQDYYRKLLSVLVYPTSFVVPERSRNEVGIVTEDESHLLGESWEKGVVIIAWDRTLEGGRKLHDGNNLIFHEFAHQLDTEDNAADGTPILENKARYLSWIKVMSKRYMELTRNTKRGKRTFLGGYAATDAAEFFAVVTERFFENPLEMGNQMPDLYEELRKYYKQDPITYVNIDQNEDKT